MPNNSLENHELVCCFLVHFFGPVVFVILLFSYFLWILITTLQDNNRQTALPRHTIIGFSIVLLVFAPVLLVAHWIFFHFDKKRHPYGGGLMPHRELELEHVAGTLRHSLAAITAALPSQQPRSRDEEANPEPDQLTIHSLDTANLSLASQGTYNPSLQDVETTPRVAFTYLDSGIPDVERISHSQWPDTSLLILPPPPNVRISRPCLGDHLLDDGTESSTQRHLRGGVFTPRVRFDVPATKRDRPAVEGGDDVRRWEAPAGSRSLTDHSVRARRSLSYLRAAATDEDSAAGAQDGGFCGPYTPYDPTRGSHSDGERGYWVRDGAPDDDD